MKWVNGSISFDTLSKIPFWLVCYSHGFHVHTCTQLFSDWLFTVCLYTGSDSSAPAAPRQMLAVPQNVTASIGDSVSFQCIVGGRSAVHTLYMYMWSHSSLST